MLKKYHTFYFGIILSISALFLLSFSAVLFAENVVSDKSYTYLLLGQSNMAGQGLVSELSDEQKALDSHIKFYLNGNLASLSTLEKFGPEVSFAQVLSKKHPNSVIRLIKFAPGGSLMKDWISRDSGKHYDTLIKQVKKANGGVLPKIDGVLWMHGERDSKSKQLANHYEKELQTFFTMLKKDFQNDQLPVALARISIPDAFRPAVAEIRSAEEHIAQISPFIHLISTDDLSKKSDKVHFDTQGQLVLGKRFAHIFMP